MRARRESWRWAAGALAVLLLLGLSPRGSAGAAFDDLAVGMPAPEFKLKDYSEQEAEVALSSFKGEKVVVLLFGSSTTWPYIKQIEPVSNLVRKYRAKPLEIFTIYTREAEGTWQPKDSFEKSQRAKGVRYAYAIQSRGKRLMSKVLIDDLDDAVFKAYGGVHGSAFVVDKEGKIAYKAADLNPAAIEQVVQKLLQP